MAQAGQATNINGNRFLTGLDSTGFPEAADISTADHTFSSTARMLRVVASSTATLIFRPHGGNADVTVTLAAGVEYLPFQVTVIRRSGTTSTLEIVGIL